VRIVFRGGLDEMVSIEEVGAGKVKVEYSNNAVTPKIDVSVVSDVRDNPSIAKWLMVGNEMMKGLREGVSVNGVPIINNNPTPNGTNPTDTQKGA
jgi:hypothetical protein